MKQELCIVLLLTVLSVIQFQGEGQPPLKQQYTQHLETNLIRSGANYQAVGNFAAGPQWIFPTSPQLFGWSMPPGNGNYEFNPVAGMNNKNLGFHNTTFEEASGEPCQQLMIL